MEKSLRAVGLWEMTSEGVCSRPALRDALRSGKEPVRVTRWSFLRLRNLFRAVSGTGRTDPVEMTVNGKSKGGYCTEWRAGMTSQQGPSGFEAGLLDSATLGEMWQEWPR